ncbi:hypothetical protein [Actinocorallia longicatena]|uniref:Magnesium transporter NIPA n=1 Tax=Actinocorallia longicatena TaxID=111803 RepID=A0ABP6Q174_9ACTN
MEAALTAVVATALYYLGVAFFKVSAAQMDRLRGTKPVHLLVAMLTSRLWWTGFLLGLSGFVLQFVALSMLPLSVAQPIFVSTLVVCLAIAFGYFGERLTPREWSALGLFAFATLLVALSVVPVERSDTATPPLWLLLAVTLPSILIAVMMFSAGDWKPAGRHARKLTGVAYGLSSGVLIGTMELSVKGMSNVWNAHHSLPPFLTNPYLYTFCVAAVVGLGQLQIALQRCRMAIVLTVCTVVAKTQLLVTATLLYGEAWPDSTVYGALRLTGFLLGLTALAFFPRYETPDHQIDPLSQPHHYATRHPF